MASNRLKPGELHPSNLSKAFRGYDARQVEELLRRASEEVSTLESELGAAISEADRIRAEYEALKADESAIKGALISAQHSAEETRSNAQRQADAILEETRRKAAELEQELQRRLTSVRFELEKLNLDKQRFISQFRAMLEQYLSTLVESQPIAGNGHPLSIADTMSAPKGPDLSSTQAPTETESPPEPVSPENG
jgi:cell division initiation protein